jgi:hypothetical protein
MAAAAPIIDQRRLLAAQVEALASPRRRQPSSRRRPTNGITTSASPSTSGRPPDHAQHRQRPPPSPQGARARLEAGQPGTDQRHGRLGSQAQVGLAESEVDQQDLVGRRRRSRDRGDRRPGRSRQVEPTGSLSLMKVSPSWPSMKRSQPAMVGRGRAPTSGAARYLGSKKCPWRRRRGDAVESRRIIWRDGSPSSRPPLLRSARPARDDR